MTTEKTKGGQRRSSVCTENHDSASKKARVSSSLELKYGCSFCPERFNLLVTVRDHTRNEHEEQNERRKIERLVGLMNGKNRSLNVPKPGSQSNKNNNDDKKTPLYRCVACTFASVSYGLMIEHCQHHIIDEASEDVIIKPITAIQTEVKGEPIDVDSHTFKKLNEESNVNSFMFIDCDYELLKSDKWPANFETFNKYEIDNINCSSIYYFTRIIHLTSDEKTSFAPFMLYKCMKCVKYIDPHSVLAHVQENSCSKRHKGFFCYECDLPFLTENSMYLHYKTHKVTTPDMNYMTISFNYEADKQINAILLKAAGRDMRESGNNYTVQQTPGTVQPEGGTAQLGPGNIAQPQVGVNSTIQRGPAIARPQVGVNSTVQQGHGKIGQSQSGVKSTAQQGPDIAQPGGVNSTLQLPPGPVQPQVGVKSTIQQGPGIAQPLGGVNSTLQQTPGPVQSQGGVNSTVQQSSRTLQPQGGVNSSVQHVSSIAQQQVRVNSTVQQTHGPLQPQGGVNSTVQQSPGTLQPQVVPTPQRGVNSTVKQGSSIAQQQVGVNRTVQQGPGIALPRGGVNSTVQQGPGNEQLARVNKLEQQSPAIVQSQVQVKNIQKTKDARTMIIKVRNKTKESSEIAHNTVKDNVALVYKCQCELCFHMLDPLFKHIDICTANLLIKTITCLCSLVFDEQQYVLHDNLHSRGVAKFIVKKVIVCNDKVITSTQHDFKKKAGNKEDKTKRVTKKVTKAKTLKNLNKEAKKTIDEIRKNAISQLTTSILNLPSMLKRVGDFKFVKNQRQTTVTSTRAVDPKSNDVTDKSAYKSDGSVFTTVAQTVHEANEEKNTKQYQAGISNVIVQTDKNVVVSDKTVDSDLELAMDENKVINSVSSNTEENQYMDDTTIEVELAAKNNAYMANMNEHTKTLESNKETEAMNLQSKKLNEFEEIIEEVLKVSECNISKNNNANEPEVKDVVAESKIYTEDELLNEDEVSNEETSVYFDADLLTDDDDPILL